MNFLQRIWNNIVVSNDQPYIDRINNLNKSIKSEQNDNQELTSKLNTEIINYNEVKKQFDLAQDQNNELKDELAQYKHIKVPYTIPKDIIDTSKWAYLPSTLIYYYDNAHKKITTKSLQVTPSKFYKMWTDEMYSYFRNETKDCKTFDDKILKLRDLVTNRTTYKTDAGKNGLHPGENWRFPTETFYGRVGDCEDSTSLWVTACKICDIPADRVFNATGYYNDMGNLVGHSFGIAKMDDGEWYVIETTAIRPKLKLKGNKFYYIKGFLNGLSNWAISGTAKKEQF